MSASAATEVADLQTMRRSFRCFWFGVGGLLPVVGAGLAWQALKLERAIFSARLRWDFRWAIWGTLAVATPFLILSVNWPPLLMATVMVAALGSSMDWRKRRAANEEKWNPAAGWACAGASLARVGLAGTVIFVLAVLANVFDFILFGVK